MDNKQWIDATWDKIEKKMEKTVLRNTEKLPYFSSKGVFDDRKDTPCWWTNGFWPGISWLLYCRNKKDIFKNEAEKAEKFLDNALYQYYELDHDVGFMWKLSAGANYRITGNEISKKRCLYAANVLAGRFIVRGGYIQAWNGEERKNLSIIDCMMNLPLLFWASRELKDDRFKNIAFSHADATMKNHVREDGSVHHIVKYSITGEPEEVLAGQGYAKNSSWSRGQAWAIYGFILSYIHTQKKEYLETAIKCADYFISNVCDDWLTVSDFKAPKEPVVYDSSAGAVAASGFLEISRVLGDDGQKYFDAALNILKAMDRHFCNWDEEFDSILQCASEAYIGTRDISLIYGDYFFIEAISKLKGNSILFWY